MSKSKLIVIGLCAPKGAGKTFVANLVSGRIPRSKTVLASRISTSQLILNSLNKAGRSFGVDPEIMKNGSHHVFSTETGCYVPRLGRHLLIEHVETQSFGNRAWLGERISESITEKVRDLIASAGHTGQACTGIVFVDCFGNEEEAAKVIRDLGFWDLDVRFLGLTFHAEPSFSGQSASQLHDKRFPGEERRCLDLAQMTAKAPTGFHGDFIDASKDAGRNAASNAAIRKVMDFIDWCAPELRIHTSVPALSANRD